jgi:sRNA-binding carbon storage regulator CsrA
MLVLSRGVGGMLRIGASKLGIRRVKPSVQLVAIDCGEVKEFEFSLEEVYRNPVIQLQQAKVKLMRVKGSEIVLAIDAPLDVQIHRGEAPRPRPSHDSAVGSD